MHLYISFHKLALTRCGSYTELPKSISLKKAAINPKNTDEKCFKWAFIVALHNKEIKKDPQRNSKLERYKNKYNWQRFEFPLAIQKIGKFEKSILDIAVNVLFNSMKGIHTAGRSELYGKCSKQVKLLLTVDGETDITQQKRTCQSLLSLWIQLIKEDINCVWTVWMVLALWVL